jgi:hypothetical protein
VSVTIGEQQQHRPALVVTDNHNLRQMLQEQHFKRVVTPPGLPLHISKAKHQTLEA